VSVLEVPVVFPVTGPESFLGPLRAALEQHAGEGTTIRIAVVSHIASCGWKGGMNIALFFVSVSEENLILFSSLSSSSPTWHHVGQGPIGGDPGVILPTDDAG
jgi:hypothetical protein